MPSPFDNRNRRIVLLYNDRERALVEAVYDEMFDKLGNGSSIRPWMASRDLTAFGTLFEQIEEAIGDAVGSVVFLGPLGLGNFQRNIEAGAVSTERWQRGAAYGTLLVHLEAKLEVPRPLLQWPSVNHDGSIFGPAALVQAIMRRFGIAEVARESGM